MSQQQLDKILKIFEKQNAPSNSGKPPSLKKSRQVLDDNGAKFKVPGDVSMEPVSADGVDAEFLTALVQILKRLSCIFTVVATPSAPSGATGI